MRRPLEDHGVPFATRLASFGDLPALVTADRVVSYAELAGLVADQADRLGAVRRLVLLTGSNDLATVVAYLGALAGGHPVLMVPGGQDDNLAATVAAYDPDVVVRAGVLEERRPGTAHDLHPSLALLLSTSGSTGSPRLVRLSRDNLQANAESIADYLAIRDSDLAATTLPLHYCYGLSVLHSHLTRGAAVLLTSLSVVDRCFWDLVERAGVTSFAGVPYTFELLDRVGFDSMDLPSLRYLTQAGGRMEPERVLRYAELGQRRGFDLFVMYGQTEATARMAYLPPDLALEHPTAVGVAVPGGSLRLDPLPEDPAVGELVFDGPNVMLGYAESPADLALGRVTGELRTGDLARRTEGGLFELVGRRARFAKVYGVRTDLDQLERLLAEQGHRAWCTGDDDRILVAVESRGRDGDRRLVDRVARLVRVRTGLPASALSVRAVEEPPRLPTGKPDYRAIAALVTAQDAAPALTASTDLREVFTRVLGVPVDHQDTFVSLGGDSLSYVEMSVRLEEALGHLPARWHLTPVGELERSRRRARSRLRTVETNVVLRALAIVAIVGTHGNLLAIAGGAHLLLGLAGFNLGRFQLAETGRVERLRKVLTSTLRVAVPSVLWIGAVTLATAAYPWQTAVLVNGLAGPPGWSEPAWHYWFVEAVVAILLGVAALLAVPAVHRLERRWPFWFPVALAVLALVTRYELVTLRGGDVIHRAHIVFWLFALGWAAARAVSWRHRAVVSALVVASVPGFFGDLAREAVVVGGLLALVWVPQLRLPAPLARACGLLASASLYIYLSHWQVYPHLEDRYPLAAVAASLAAGIAMWQLADRLPRRVPAARRWLRPLRRQRSAPLGGEVSARSPASSTGLAPGTTPTATGVPTA